jgi:hypothetical protein
VLKLYTAHEWEVEGWFEIFLTWINVKKKRRNKNGEKTLCILGTNA